MESISIKRGIEICVNDNGETINVDLDNTLFLEKFNGLIERVGKIADSIDTKAELTDTEALKLVTDKMEEVIKEIDNVFGADTCKKVFGEGVIPTPYPVMDFFEQMNPIVEKYSKARENKIKMKYGNRTGGKKR